ncbi:MAG: phosphotransferase family protein [Actinomycetota bacterium]
MATRGLAVQLQRPRFVQGRAPDTALLRGGDQRRWPECDLARGHWRRTGNTLVCREARNRGTTSGARSGHLDSPRLADENWLSRGWLRAYVARRASDMAVLQTISVEDSPLTRAAIPNALVTELVRVWHERNRFLDAIDQVPQTLCHNDFWPKNLFSEGEDSTVAIDWAYAGIGGAGQDIGNFPAALLNMIVGVDHIEDLERRIWTGYVMGLRDAGWDGDVPTVRLAFAASAAVKYPWIVPRMIEIAHNPDLIANFERGFGASIEEILRVRVVVLEHLVALADEARRLMSDR